MKAKVYTRFLNLTSVALNVCVKLHWWAVVKHIIEFRKKHIGTPLRMELARH
jgi:hypothetical protein